MDTSDLDLPFGDSKVSIRVPMTNLLGVWSPMSCGGDWDEDALLRGALARPIDAPRLADLAQSGQKVVIVVSDLTRPCPSSRLLPIILQELGEAGIPDADMAIVIAVGFHRPMTRPEMRKLVGTEVCDRVKVINHDPALTVRLGVTGRGTPLEVFRPVAEADLRICIANLDLHYFAGYSGGAKSILPGCASEAAIRANHSMLAQEGAAAGRLEGNPVRLDMEEAGRIVGVDFILNVVVDERKRIVGAVAGDVTGAHRRGCELVKRRCSVVIPKLADVVIVSAGGYPKDLNLYQAQKALANAVQAVKPGGIIILVAECREGFGNRIFQDWLCNARSPDELLDRLRHDFVLGGHKAAAVATVMRQARISLVSLLPEEQVRSCGLAAFQRANEALRAALDEVGAAADVVVLPYGGSVLPMVGKNRDDRD
jgi:nickel-dependent lactate racemase